MNAPRALLLLALLFVGCGDTQSTSSHEPPAVLGGPTTDGDIARANLDARIAGLEAALERTPHLFSLRRSLVEALLTRTTLFGTYTDFDRALALTEAPDTDAKRRLRARALQAVHRFSEALEILGDVNGDDLRGTIDLALERNLDDVLAAREAAAAQYPTYANWYALAAVKSRRGDFDGADAAWVAAGNAYQDVSPFPYALIAFQRGVMWAEVAGRPDRALPLYREALRRVPGYVTAAVHLAELEASQGQHALAVSLLETVLAHTDDPEPFGLLGELTGAPAPIAEASTRYDALLGSHRAAFLDHGSEFFAGPGQDVGRALELALENLDLRPTERARQVAIEAALAADDPIACGLAAAVDGPISQPLAELAAHVDALFGGTCLDD